MEARPITTDSPGNRYADRSEIPHDSAGAQQRLTEIQRRPTAYFLRLGFTVSFTASPTAFFRFSANRLASVSLMMVAWATFSP